NTLFVTLPRRHGGEVFRDELFKQPLLLISAKAVVQICDYRLKSHLMPNFVEKKDYTSATLSLALDDEKKPRKSSSLKIALISAMVFPNGCSLIASTVTSFNNARI